MLTRDNRWVYAARAFSLYTSAMMITSLTIVTSTKKKALRERRKKKRQTWIIYQLSRRDSHLFSLEYSKDITNELDSFICSYLIGNRHMLSSLDFLSITSSSCFTGWHNQPYQKRKEGWLNFPTDIPNRRKQKQFSYFFLDWSDNR